MNQIIKYLLVAILSIALTIFYLDQHAPIIVEVPEKTSQRMSITLLHPPLHLALVLKQKIVI